MTGAHHGTDGRWPRRRRGGNYALIFAFVVPVLLGFGALALDTSYMLLAQSQSQAIADATSQAALVALRQTGDVDKATAAAEAVLEANLIVGKPASMELTFGTWDDTDDNPRFDEDPTNPNAVRSLVTRRQEEAVPYLLARIWGHEDFDVGATATSATRSLQVIVVLDITGSWGERDFNEAREAVLVALDMLAESASDIDEVGMTIFTNRFAWEYTPLSTMADDAQASAIRADWEQLAVASKAGRDENHRDGVDCRTHWGARLNDFSDPEGGCYPAMPREYRDERGTDHSTGILLAKQMFEESGTGANYRAMIVVTDGRPNGFGPAGTARGDDDYVETRWREYLGPAPRRTWDIRQATVSACRNLWSGLRVNTWVVSLVEHHAMMDDMPQGDGYYTLTQDSGELASILAQIVSELPLAIVE